MYNAYQRPSKLDQFAPPVTRNLIVINLIVWFAELLFAHRNIDLVNLLGLHYWGASDFRVWQFVTNMFLHDTNGFGHIFFNMFSLWMFGRTIEHFWGGKRYLFFYITCGLTASLLQELVWLFELMDAPAVIQVVEQGFVQAVPRAEYLNGVLAVGASGAIFGLLLAFGMLFPNSAIYLFFIPIPIKAKFFVIGYGLFELFFGVASTMPGHTDSIAHFAHLGGMIGGIILILVWRKKGAIDGPYN